MHQDPHTADPSERSMAELTTIYQEMRVLQFNHVINPKPNDIQNYLLLMQDLEAAMSQLTTALTDSAEGLPVPIDLVTADFPRPVTETMGQQPERDAAQATAVNTVASQRRR